MSLLEAEVVSVSFLGSGRRLTVDVTIVYDQIKRLPGGIQPIATMHGAAVIANLHILENSVKRNVNDRHREQAQSEGPWNENGSYDYKGKTGCAIEILLNVELRTFTRRTRFDQSIGSGSYHLIVA